MAGPGDWWLGAGVVKGRGRVKGAKGMTEELRRVFSNDALRPSRYVADLADCGTAIAHIGWQSTPK